MSNTSRPTPPHPTLPQTARPHLRQLFLAYQLAQQTYQAAFTTAMEMLGLDPQVAWNVNFDTGVIVPANNNGVSMTNGPPPDAPTNGVHKGDVPALATQEGG